MEWWRQPRSRWRTVHHLAQRTEACLAMASSLDLLGRTAELARVFGIEFNAVLMRGSQYRVESMMIRMARTQNFLMVTPQKIETENQPAMESQPVVMEPESGFYTSPVVVLDFQSLYPSQIIAYNICYSTCLGKTPTPGSKEAAEVLAGKHRRFGAAGLTLPKGLLAAAEERVHITPNGAPPTQPTHPRVRPSIHHSPEHAAPFLAASLWIAGLLASADTPSPIALPPARRAHATGTMFLPPDMRAGLLPRLLSEILDTRVMVKSALKKAQCRPDCRVLARCLNARQFGLKMIANVTYGYTAAGLSGRMPCAEIADAIVSSGRETLERAIQLVNSHPEWRAEARGEGGGRLCLACL